jgi:polygalacturonase
MLDRRSILAAVTAGLAAPLPALGAPPVGTADAWGAVSVRDFGAVGDGASIDSGAVNRAIDHVAGRGGGVVLFPAGTFACHSIRLKSGVGLHLDHGAVLLAAPPPAEGQPGGYDAAEPQGAWEPFQDFGHNHWHDALIWGEGLHDISITGPGLIWGKGLSRGRRLPTDPSDAGRPGVGTKAIALKNCRNVLLRDFRVLEGGWFVLLATGVDNLTISNLVFDTNRDGMDIDCCRNVRISDCSINSPWDDGICLKSSFALGYPRATEDVTISGCFVTGDYEMGSMLDGSWRRMPADFAPQVHGRIKFGTESNGGFRNITISNCVFESSGGFALETVDGGILEDVTISNIAMRGTTNAPLFMRLGRRMRGPPGRPIGTLKRVLISNVTSYDSSLLPSIIAGLPDHPIEDIKISDVLLHQRGGAPAALATRRPPEAELAYPEPTMFGDLPASGVFVRHARNIEVSNVEVATAEPDPRPAFRLEDVDGADFFRARAPQGPMFSLSQVRQFRTFGSPGRPDRSIAQAASARF